MPAPLPDVGPTLGAYFIGLLFAAVLQGALTVQAYIYFESFRRDPLRTRLLVAAVWILDLAHLVLISQATYHYLVTNWGNVEVINFSTIPLDTHLALIGLATILCQSFFVQRIYVFSGRNVFLICFLVLGCLATLTLEVLLTVQISVNLSVSSFTAHPGEVVAVFAMGASFDLLIAGLLCYYLNREKSGFDRTDSVVGRVIQDVVATGLMTSLLAVACLIAYLANPEINVFIALHFSLGRMYTNALLLTLNERRNLRADMGSSVMIRHVNPVFSPGRSLRARSTNHIMTDPETGESFNKFQNILITRTQHTIIEEEPSLELTSLPPPPRSRTATKNPLNAID